MLVAGMLRFYRIGEPGFTEGADCMYTETAHTLLLLAKWGWNNPQLLGSGEEATAELSAFFDQQFALPRMPYSAKPLYDFMNVLALGVGGFNDGILPAISALMGTLSVVVIFLLGKQLYGERAGVWAAALLTVSGGALVFSRYGQSHMASIFFFIIGFWLYLRSISPAFSLRILCSSSLFFAVALTTHPNVLPYVGLFPLYEVALLFRKEFSWRMFFQRAGVGLGVLVLLGVLLNIPFQVIEHYFGPFFAKMGPQMGWPFMTYFEQIPHHFGLVVTKAAPGVKERIYTYLIEAWAWEGSLICGLVCVALVLRLRSFKEAHFHDLIIFSQLVLPLLFWIFTENQAVLRYAAGTLPIVLIIAARELDHIAVAVKDRFGCKLQTAIGLLCLLVMGFNVPHSLIVFQAQSAFKEVSAWLRTHDQASVVVNHPMSYRFYGILPVSMNAVGLTQAQYIAFYERYLSEKERKVLSVLSTQKPVLEVRDRRPGKMLEVDFMNNNLVLKLLQGVPGIGFYVKEMRETVLERNRMRYIAVYDITPLRLEITTVLSPFEQADLNGSENFSWK